METTRTLNPTANPPAPPHTAPHLAPPRATEEVPASLQVTKPAPIRHAPKVAIHSPSMIDAWVQKSIGWLVLLPFCGFIVFLFRFVGRYQVPNLRAIRRQYREVIRECRRTNTPLMICGNHLTFIDSALMIWVLANNFWYVFHHRAFMWNLPAGDFFKKKRIFRLVAYLSKCIFIHRDGPRSHHISVLNLCRELLRRGEVVTIFPEGRRSRTGRFETEKLTYGAAKIISQLERCNVLCIYLRGDRQETYTNYPSKGSIFHFEMKMIAPRSSQRGKLAYQEITGQIAGTIHEMETRYFARRGAPRNPLSC